MAITDKNAPKLPTSTQKTLFKSPSASPKKDNPMNKRTSLQTREFGAKMIVGLLASELTPRPSILSKATHNHILRYYFKGRPERPVLVHFTTGLVGHRCALQFCQYLINTWVKPMDDAMDGQMEYSVRATQLAVLHDRFVRAYRVFFWFHKGFSQTSTLNREGPSCENPVQSGSDCELAMHLLNLIADDLVIGDPYDMRERKIMMVLTIEDDMKMYAARVIQAFFRRIADRNAGYMAVDEALYSCFPDDDLEIDEDLSIFD